MDSTKMELKNGRKDEGVNRPAKNRKSTFWTYLLWTFGGLFGAHHVYLERDEQAFVYFCTLGGFVGLGWLRDISKIPSYVDDANEEPRFVHFFKQKVRYYSKVLDTFTARFDS